MLTRLFYEVEVGDKPYTAETVLDFIRNYDLSGKVFRQVRELVNPYLLHFKQSALSRVKEFIDVEAISVDADLEQKEPWYTLNGIADNFIRTLESKVISVEDSLELAR
ncbi:hypothetical protein KY330_03735 [Candidatus Woesearchaeota archaeon]|nr:hypothetical protein [Candidatus Woesearchaeota archaeon]